MTCPECGKHISPRAKTCFEHRPTPDISKARAAYLAGYGCEPFDAELVRRKLDSYCCSVREAERALGWGDGTLAHAMRRGTLNYYRLDKLATWLGLHTEEVAA